MQNQEEELGPVPAQPCSEQQPPAASWYLHHKPSGSGSSKDGGAWSILIPQPGGMKMLQAHPSCRESIYQLPRAALAKAPSCPTALEPTAYPPPGSCISPCCAPGPGHGRGAMLTLLGREMMAGSRPAPIPGPPEPPLPQFPSTFL